MTSLQKSEVGRWLLLLAALMIFIAQDRLHAAQPAIGVVHATPVLLAQANAARDGAGELMVLMEIARVQSQPEKGGLIGIGDRRGRFSCDAEEALRLAVLNGIPVVKLAPRGEVVPAPHGLFLDGGALTEDDARRVLASCLTKFGSLPKAQSSTPSVREIAAIQDRLRFFQNELSLATRIRYAAQ